MATYKSLTQIISSKNLSEGDTINVQRYIKKLKVFKEYSFSEGMYITDRRYEIYSEIGLHFYKYQTLIDYFSKCNKDILTIKFNTNWKIDCY